MFRNPATSILAVVILTSGIGLSATMYSFLNAFVLRGLPFEGADHLVHFMRGSSQRERDYRLSYHDFYEYRVHSALAPFGRNFGQVGMVSSGCGVVADGRSER